MPCTNVCQEQMGLSVYFWVFFKKEITIKLKFVRHFELIHEYSIEYILSICFPTNKKIKCIKYIKLKYIQSRSNSVAIQLENLLEIL